MSRRLSSRLPFLFAVALVAAGLGDPVVESIANTGIFGQYVDNNHLGVLPMLLTGTVVVAELLLLRCIEAWRRSTDRMGDSLIDIAHDFGSRSIACDFPLIFVLQLLSVFIMESGEQLVAGGTLPAGMAWLGGPILFSLTAYAVIAALCTFALGVGMRAIVVAFSSLVLTAVRFIWLAAVRTVAGAFRLGRTVVAFARTQAPHVQEIGGRAPPLLHTA